MKGDCTFLYFKPYGKWKYEGRGYFPKNLNGGYHQVDRNEIIRENGSMPGITSRASDLIVIVIPDEDCAVSSAFPRMLCPEDFEAEEVLKRRAGMSARMSERERIRKENARLKAAQIKAARDTIGDDKRAFVAAAANRIEGNNRVIAAAIEGGREAWARVVERYGPINPTEPVEETLTILAKLIRAREDRE